MGISRVADVYYTYRFIKTLVTKWEDMDAYKLGIIDEKGKNLIKYRKLKTNEQKDAFTTFHRLVFNIKRLMEIMPFGRSKLASYAAALFLLREETGMSEEGIMNALDELGYEHHLEDELDLTEDTLVAGEYILNHTLSEEFSRGKVVTLVDLEPIGKFSQTFIYKTAEGCHVTYENLR
ncbi:MAG: hypothetical protein CMD98_06850 [Gammaproteobacteria bacterium]|nr:hypothetical protein [Gammaproteobacteria bacterium]|tara:strand:+ start:39919 stop:40452 length:534 start_codon:yes stop_codon:yes gene_type:complete